MRGSDIWYKQVFKVPSGVAGKTAGNTRLELGERLEDQVGGMPLGKRERRKVVYFPHPTHPGPKRARFQSLPITIY